MGDLRDILQQMTLEEKAGFCSGRDFWHTKSADRLGVHDVMVADGPNGLRKQKDESDPVGLNESLPATCFPTAVTTACSFDRDLLFSIGAAIGEEALQENLAIVLGPGVNIKRSPLCGRNFEYISEDPYVAGEMAAALIQGLQSKNVGASVKHFACNNQEKGRMINDSIVDERALREIYLTAFEIAVKKAQPWTLMCSYNKLNGTYTCENEKLLTAVPRQEWGFQGAIMSDWGAINERVPALQAGLDLEMPYAGPWHDDEIVAAVKSGALDEAVLDRAVLRVLEIIAKNKPNVSQPYDINAHDLLARNAVCESAVLLKNDGILPVRTDSRLAVIGEFAQTPRYQGTGSSKINPNRVTSAIDELTANGADFIYARGYDLHGKTDAAMLIAQAAAAAKDRDVVFIYAGLPDAYESEGYDRTNIDMPLEHNDLIEQVAAVNPNVVVILHAGSAIRLPWLDKVRGVLLLALGGQNAGGASVDLVFGRANPSGKLTETYPLELADTPAGQQFGQRLTTEYRESVYVGYRYYDKAEKAVLFPFGFGLSYTSFAYSDLNLSNQRIKDTETLIVSLKVKNTGGCDGKEAVQLYVAPPASAIFKPLRELRAFAKVALRQGEEKEITLTLGRRAFAYWNVNINDWHVESGRYQIQVGSSSRDIRCTADVELESTAAAAVPSYRDAAPIYYNLTQGTLDVPREQFEIVFGAKLPPDQPNAKAPFTLNSTAWDVRHTIAGKILIHQVKKGFAAATGNSDPSDDATIRMFDALLYEMPIRSMGMGGVPLPLLKGVVMVLNRRYIKGIRAILKSRKNDC